MEPGFDLGASCSEGVESDFTGIVNVENAQDGDLRDSTAVADESVALPFPDEDGCCHLRQKVEEHLELGPFSPLILRQMS